MTLDPQQAGAVVRVRDIASALINTGSGEVYPDSGGYLDVGILDTMKDPLVNLIGAIVFSVIGCIALRTSGSGKVTENLTIRPNVHDENR